MNDVRLKVLVEKDKLTSRGIVPSSQELFDLMHLTTCHAAVMMWKPAWMFCPVCMATFDRDGEILHRDHVAEFLN